MAIGCTTVEMPSYEDLKTIKEIERSLTKTHKKDIWSPFLRAIKDFKLIEADDTVAIAISGGKDSLLLAKLIQMLHRHTEVPFTPVYLSMDPGFHQVNRQALLRNCAHLEIPVQLFDSDIFEVVGRISEDYPCYMCARMRRGFLYAKAQELGANKLALGHHFDDAIETTLLNLFYTGCFKTMVPKLHSSNFEGLELIRPLYYVREESIKRFISKSGVPAMNCGCIVAAGKTSSKRKEIKDLIATLKETNPLIDKCIFNAASNINLDAILGYQEGDKKFDFNELYAKRS